MKPNHVDRDAPQWKMYSVVKELKNMQRVPFANSASKVRPYYKSRQFDLLLRAKTAFLER